jgi:hypothetical protein
MLPTWFLLPSGHAAVKARAAELQTYLVIRRAMRAASANWVL